VLVETTTPSTVIRQVIVPLAPVFCAERYAKCPRIIVTEIPLVPDDLVPSGTALSFCWTVPVPDSIISATLLRSRRPAYQRRRTNRALSPETPPEAALSALLTGIGWNRQTNLRINRQTKLTVTALGLIASRGHVEVDVPRLDTCGDESVSLELVVLACGTDACVSEMCHDGSLPHQTPKRAVETPGTMRRLTKTVRFPATAEESCAFVEPDRMSQKTIVCCVRSSSF